MQARSITRGFRAAVCTAGLLIGGVGLAPSAQDTSRPGAVPNANLRWREAPEYVALFAPRSIRDAYRAFVTDAGMDEALRRITADPAITALAGPGSWRAAPENPFDAFGGGGTYDRWRVARLYRSRRPLVARGPRGTADAVAESWTLISPYPSPGLDALEPGTLLIAVRVP